MDETTRLASEAIIRGLDNAGCRAAVPHIVRELHAAAIAANGTIGREHATQIMVLANAIEIDAEVAAKRNSAGDYDIAKLLGQGRSPAD